MFSSGYTKQEDMDAEPQPHIKGSTASTTSTREEVRIYRPLGSIMADFQETQAILVATVQVATPVYFNANALVRALDTFGEAIANLDVIRRPTFDGIMPVLLGQFICSGLIGTGGTPLS
ncbi:hypothetical protein F5Y08DRAFT_344157 [Xylaria arbuscula]|nr:hypothetical protein F5Y08DRAFT_344157 [Xylaria arbuscula]